MKKYDVIALGEVLMDFNSNGKNQDQNIDFEACPGGAPANVLAMLAKLGRQTAFIGKVGDDQFGYYLQETLENAKIDCSYLYLSQEAPTTLAFVHKLEDGDRDFSFYRKQSADLRLSPEEVSAELISQGRIFHCGSLSMCEEPARSATIKALELAQEAGLIISFDPNYRDSLWSSPQAAKAEIDYILEYTDILKIADNEVELVTGEKDYDLGVAYLQEKYNIPLILLSLGAKGSRAYYLDLKLEVQSRKVNLVDATGAGDTFCAVCLDYILDHAFNLDEVKLKQMLRRANLAASIVVEKKGAILSMPGEDQIEALVNAEN